ncbi:hypothetical protein ACFYO0_13630 [Streptomyces sp. NPDC006365]|uniref:hypothetical protein n=1 Tax=Streptomyces sp. NPDC006365 TaxID=3364744 RepID=UPI0036B677B5
MKLTWPLLGWALFALFCAAWVAFLVLGVLDEVGVIDISWMPKSEESSGDVDPGGYNQGPNQVPVRPGPPAGGARGR